MIPYIFLGLGALSLGVFLFKRDKKSSIVAIALKALTSLFFLLTALFSLYENREKGDITFWFVREDSYERQEDQKTIHDRRKSLE